MKNIQSLCWWLTCNDTSAKFLFFSFSFDSASFHVASRCRWPPPVHHPTQNKKRQKTPKTTRSIFSFVLFPFSLCGSSTIYTDTQISAIWSFTVVSQKKKKIRWHTHNTPRGIIILNNVISIYYILFYSRRARTKLDTHTHTQHDQYIYIVWTYVDNTILLPSTPPPSQKNNKYNKFYLKMNE